jgi:hypothetical protein
MSAPNQVDTVPLGRIVLGVFLGMWLFAVTGGLVALILKATGDLPK